MKPTLYLFGIILVALLGGGLAGCASQPPTQGGAPVEERSVRPPPPQEPPVVPEPPPAVQVTPLARPDPILPETGPVVPDDPYSNTPQVAWEQQPGASIPYPEARTYPQAENTPEVGVYSETPSQAEATPADAEMTTTPPGNQAVIALLDSAATHVNEGELDKAAASLERALRIEPRNAGIWHDLGQIRLHQGQYQQAESLATKSNSLATENSMLKARNWRLIASARRAVGDQVGADAAEAQAIVAER